MSMKTISFSAKHFPVIAQYIKHDGVAIIPTDTIPGFSVSPHSQTALRNLQRIKKRPEAKPFLLLVSDFFSAEKICNFSAVARDLGNRYWPGALTLVLPRKKGVLPHFFPHESELALRIPGNKTLRKFLNIFGGPLVSTSINTAGNPPLVFAKEIEKAFGDEEILLSLSCNKEFVSGDIGASLSTRLSSDYSERRVRSDYNTQPSTIVRVRGEKIEILRKGSVVL